MNNRIGFIDSGKGLGIFLVVLGHFYMYSGQFDNHIVKIIYLFHMPLFFFLSGLVTKYVVGSWYFLKKKANRLLLPFGTWFCFYVLLWHNSLVAIFDEMKMGVWYLQILFSFYAVHCLCCLLCSKINRKNNWSIDVALGFGFYLSFKIIYHICMYAPFDLNGLMGNIHFINYWIYFYIGVLLHKHHVVQKCLSFHGKTI